MTSPIRNRLISFSRCYASIATPHVTPGAITIDQDIYASTSVKPPTSKKSLLHESYVDFYTQNPTMLILQHNNLTQSQLLKIRADLKQVGARLRIIRVGIFEHAVRVSTFLQKGALSDDQRKWQVNSKAMSRYVKRNAVIQGLDVTQLLSGPICTVTFPDSSSTANSTTTAAPTEGTEMSERREVTPERLNKTMKVVSNTQGRLLLLGGKFENQVFTVDSLDRISTLPGLETLRGQLLSLLGAPALKLTQILGAPGQQLARTLEGRKLALEEPEENKS